MTTQNLPSKGHGFVIARDGYRVPLVPGCEPMNGLLYQPEGHWLYLFPDEFAYMAEWVHEHYWMIKFYCTNNHEDSYNIHNSPWPFAVRLTVDSDDETVFDGACVCGLCCLSIPNMAAPWIATARRRFSNTQITVAMSLVPERG